ncbi:hypothetical protein [Candidatus Uabimicrobium sp. HlEnr_7]|uniref:hypothetical protein n=1 Tax=Candidatus Uabimicrobium helgolandensis TaxID=3095367 RepID=UPI003556346D
MKKWTPNILYFFFIIQICSCNTHSQLTVTADTQSVQKFCKDILIQEGFEIDIDKSDYINTDWKINLSPYQKKGRKEKAEIFIKPYNTQVKLEVIVAQYINYTTQDYLEKKNAAWVKNGRNRAREKWLIALIKNKLLLTK